MADVSQIGCPPHFCVVGINHKKSPLEIREQFYLRPVERELLLSELKNNPQVIAAIVLSTCNRTEIYAHMLDAQPATLLNHLFAVKNLSFDQKWKQHFYIYTHEKMVEHLFCVASGLDSIILGEKQIIGQVKEAIELSRKKGMLSKAFNILSHLAVRAGKKAQHETQISYGGSSVSWAAVTMAQKLLGTLQQKSVLLIGAGKMSKLAASHFTNRGISRLFVMNRTHEKAASLAIQFNGTEISPWDLKETLLRVDLCICAAGAPHYLIAKDLVDAVMAGRQNRPIVFLDISMPRNIDPQVSLISGVRLVTIDDLDEIAQENIQKRQAAVEQVQGIISGKISEFYTKWQKSQEAQLSDVCAASGLPNLKN